MSAKKADFSETALLINEVVKHISKKLNLFGFVGQKNLN